MTEERVDSLFNLQYGCFNESPAHINQLVVEVLAEDDRVVSGEEFLVDLEHALNGEMGFVANDVVEVDVFQILEVTQKQLVNVCVLQEVLWEEDRCVRQVHSFNEPLELLVRDWCFDDFLQIVEWMLRDDLCCDTHTSRVIHFPRVN